MSKMGTSAIKVILLFVCFDQMGVALVIPDSKIVSVQTSEQFNVHITERGTKFVEKIQIDRKNGLEYFYVPAHNGRVEGDYLYDFKQNVSIRRDKHESRCYLGPLPDKLPKPDDLKTRLQMASQSSVGRKVTVQKYWAVSDQVNKTLLSQTVQHFCGQFPVYRLREFHFKSSAGLGKRSTKSKGLVAPLCSSVLPTSATTCHPQKWIYNVKVRQTSCTYWVSGCNLNFQIVKLDCVTVKHVYSSIVCIEPTCP